MADVVDGKVPPLAQDSGDHLSPRRRITVAAVFELLDDLFEVRHYLIDTWYQLPKLYD
jgi:hypothetical protein